MDMLNMDKINKIADMLVSSDYTAVLLGLQMMQLDDVNTFTLIRIWEQRILQALKNEVSKCNDRPIIFKIGVFDRVSFGWENDLFTIYRVMKERLYTHWIEPDGKKVTTVLYESDTWGWISMYRDVDLVTAFPRVIEKYIREKYE